MRSAILLLAAFLTGGRFMTGYAPVPPGGASGAAAEGFIAVRPSVELGEWGSIQVEPPSERRERIYDFSLLDSFTAEAHEAGLVILLPFRIRSSWGTVPEMPGGSAMVRKGREEELDAFVFSMVERYDGDGISDMPGLAGPVRWFVLEPAPLHEGGWSGDPGSYFELLSRCSGDAARASNAAIILTSPLDMGEGWPFPFPKRRPLDHLSRRHPSLYSHAREITALLDPLPENVAASIDAPADWKDLEAVLEWFNLNAPERSVWILDYPLDDPDNFLPYLVTASGMGAEGVMVEGLADIPPAVLEAWRTAQGMVAGADMVERDLSLERDDSTRVYHLIYPGDPGDERWIAFSASPASVVEIPARSVRIWRGGSYEDIEGDAPISLTLGEAPVIWAVRVTTQVGSKMTMEITGAPPGFAGRGVSNNP